MNLQRGDRVHIKSLDRDGKVIEVDTRTTVVRYHKPDGESIEHRFNPEELEYLPKPHLE